MSEEKKKEDLWKYVPKGENLVENFRAAKRWLVDCHTRRVDPDWRIANMVLTHLHDFVVLPQRELIEDMVTMLADYANAMRDADAPNAFEVDSILERAAEMFKEPEPKPEITDPRVMELAQQMDITISEVESAIDLLAHAGKKAEAAGADLREQLKKLMEPPTDD